LARTGLLALRPAPVQVNYLGYPGTMGAGFIDYLIADRVIIPDELRRHYGEAVVRLPGSYQPNRRHGPVGAASRAEHGLPEDAFVFCSFNQAYKLTPEIFACWLEILRGAEGSALWILADETLGGAVLKSRAAAAGIDPGRLIFAEQV